MVLVLVLGLTFVIILFLGVIGVDVVTGNLVSVGDGLLMRMRIGVGILWVLALVLPLALVLLLVLVFEVCGQGCVCRTPVGCEPRPTDRLTHASRSPSEGYRLSSSTQQCKPSMVPQPMGVGENPPRLEKLGPLSLRRHRPIATMQSPVANKHGPIANKHMPIVNKR